MPSHHDTGWTFRDLILRVAEEYGCADQNGSVADIPSDPHNLDKVKRAVNIGYREFLSEDPDWSFRRRPFTVVTNADGAGPNNVGRDAGIYRLQRFVQRMPERDLQFTDDNYPMGMICPTSYMDILRMRQTSPSPGPPTHYHIRKADPVDGRTGQGSGGHWEIIFYPTPDSAYTFQGTCFAYPYDMVELGEQHIAGAEHDLTVLAYATKAMYINPHEDADKRESARGQAAEMLAKSKEIDRRARTGVLGVVRDPANRGLGFIGSSSPGYFPGDSGANFTYEGQRLN